MGGTFVSTQLKRPNAGELRERVSRQGSTLLDVLDLRFVVEQGVAQIAAERATDEQVRELEKFLVDMTGEGRKFPLYRDLDTRFHLLIAGATQSDRLSSMVADIHAGLSDLMALIPYSEEAVLHSSDQHTRLVAAIKKKKPEQARKIMQEHVSATSSFLRGLL
ncbi:MAG: FCD domain-containing protein [Rhodospirillales bacterium]|nr:FCD domain-containing protein [Rhodospirillales bacterium]